MHFDDVFMPLCLHCECCPVHEYQRLFVDELASTSQVRGVRTFFGISFRCRAAVLTTGTFMNGRIWVGRMSMPAGRCALLLTVSTHEYSRPVVLNTKQHAPLFAAIHRV